MTIPRSPVPLARVFAVFAVALVCSISYVVEANAVAAPNTAATIALFPDEPTSVFRPTPQPVTIAAGTVRFTVFVPPSAKRRHGVGIDGGEYDDVEGAAVAPGYSTSLTIGLTPGDYTIYDSFGDNRKLGYAMPIRVVAPRSQLLRPGRRCTRLFGTYLQDIRVRRTNCSVAERVEGSVYDAWRRTDYVATSVRTRGFSCAIRTDGLSGLQILCKRGRKEVRLTS